MSKKPASKTSIAVAPFLVQAAPSSTSLTSAEWTIIKSYRACNVEVRALIEETLPRWVAIGRRPNGPVLRLVTGGAS